MNVNIEAIRESFIVPGSLWQQANAVIAEGCEGTETSPASIPPTFTATVALDPISGDPTW